MTIGSSVSSIKCLNLLGPTYTAYFQTIPQNKYINFKLGKHTEQLELTP